MHLLQGKTIATAESCTGGGIGSALTSVPGSSSVYVGGIISYTNHVKNMLLDVPLEMLDQYGAVSAVVAEQMARGVKKHLGADIGLSVTGLAGPGGDDYSNPVGTVYIGYCDDSCCISRQFLFDGDRESVRRQAIENALKIVIELNR
jgi:PncC family amidohydrolase